MSKVNVKLLAKEDIASGTMAFHLQKPDGFEFRAGQACDLSLIHPRKQMMRAIPAGFHS